MLSYQEKQRQLFDSIEKDFKKGLAPFPVAEPVADYECDNRICLTSVAFTPPHIQEQILTHIIQPLKDVDNRQYYYVPESLHCTVQNIRTIHAPPLFSDGDIEKAKGAFHEVVPKYQPLRLDVEGLFELPTSLSLRVYSNEEFKRLTEELRKRLKKAGVTDDKSYASDNTVFGNITICRYSMQPKDAFFREVEKLKEVKVGIFDLANISLITTNLVCHPNKTSVLAQFNLV